MIRNIGSLVCALLLCVTAAGCDKDSKKELSEQEKANIDLAETQLDVFKNSINMYYVEHKAYPPTLDALAEGPHPLMKEIYKDPWNNSFIYDKPNTTIRSAGPDQKPNTDDDLVVEFGPRKKPK